jgi:hypothetical protein
MTWADLKGSEYSILPLLDRPLFEERACPEVLIPIVRESGSVAYRERGRGREVIFVQHSFNRNLGNLLPKAPFIGQMAFKTLYEHYL